MINCCDNQSPYKTSFNGLPATKCHSCGSIINIAVKNFGMWALLQALIKPINNYKFEASPP